MSEALRAGLKRLAIIPARGGSKGLPGKNLALVAGESLLARAVRCAREAGIFDTILVSTDDPAIADAGRRAGAIVPFLRSAELASDKAAVIDAVREALARLGARFDTVALLEPTSPLRTADIVRRTVALAESAGADAALTVSPAPTRYHPLKHFRIEADGRVQHAVEQGAKVVNRQELQPTYLRNGMCYAVRVSAIEAGHNMLGSALRAVVVEGPAVNIDDPADLDEARRVLEGEAKR